MLIRAWKSNKAIGQPGIHSGLPTSTHPLLGKQEAEVTEWRMLSGASGARRVLLQRACLLCADWAAAARASATWQACMAAGACCPCFSLQLLGRDQWACRRAWGPGAVDAPPHLGPGGLAYTDHGPPKPGAKTCLPSSKLSLSGVMSRQQKATCTGRYRGHHDGVLQWGERPYGTSALLFHTLPSALFPREHRWAKRTHTTKQGGLQSPAVSAASCP